MKKKMLSLFLTASMTAALLSGCGGGEAAQSTPEAAGTGDTAVAEETGAEEEEPETDNSSGEKIVLKASVMANEEEKKIFENAIARFEEANPGYTVDASYTSGSTWGEYCDKLLIQIGSGEAPDIIHVAIEGTQMLVKNDVLMPLDDMVAQDAGGQAMLDDFVKSTLDVFTINGNLYELPTDCNDAVMHINKKMFEDAGIEIPYDGWTWDEFKETAKKLTTGEGDSKVYGYATALSPAWLAGWFMSNGSDYITPDWNDSNLSDPKAIETVNFLNSLINEDKVMPTPEATLDPTSLFAAGRVAMIGTGIWPFPSYKANGFSDVDIVPFPTNSPDAKVGFGVGGVGIYSKTEHPEAAYELLKELVSTESGKEKCASGTCVPVRYSLSEDEGYLAQCPNAKLFFEALEGAQALPSPMNYSDLERITNSMFSSVFTGTSSVEDAVKSADEELKQSFADLNE